MKFILSLLLSFPVVSLHAQFHTIQQERTSYKVKEVSTQTSSVTSSSLRVDTIVSEKKDTLSNPYSHLSIEELNSLITSLELSLRNKSSASSKLPKKIHRLYAGNSRELNLPNLKAVMDELGLSNKLFVMAQALLETGNFTSRVCKKYNNLFGLYDSRNKDYFRFERWEDSVVGYKKMIQYRYKGGNYLRFLKQIGYAEDPRYITKIAKTARSLYKKNSVLFNVQPSLKS